MKQKIGFFTYFVLLIIFFETLFHLVIFKNINLNYLYIVIFSIPIGLFFTIFNFLFNEKVNKIFTYLITIFITFLFISNFIYYKLYGSVISIESFLNGAQVLQFYQKIIETILANFLVIILIFIPLITLIIINKFKLIDYQKNKPVYLLLILSIMINIQIPTLVFLRDVDSSNKETYFETNSPILVTNNFGYLTALKQDIQMKLFGSRKIKLTDEKKNNSNKKNTKTYEYNIMNINFNDLINKTSNEEMKQMYSYFENQEATLKNKYTGMFIGKNLIVFVAEAFDNVIIDKDLTPNLYKLYNEGFQFDNFYTPLFPVSTADGEYVTDTSLIPKEKVWSLKRIAGNYMPFSYPNVLEPLGYKSYSYHNHTGTYYGRDKYLETMGYDSYKACKMGLDINCGIWPKSDYEMINATYNDYINDEHFVTYYMTVSGHLNYTRMGNMMVGRNWSLVKDLPYSDKVKGYIAANIELDKAIGLLLTKLKEAGKLEDTVIMLSSDHYPYGLTLEELNELSSTQKDNDYEKYRNGFLLYSGSMKESIPVNKLGSSLDILPTVLNLFGVNYDSRLLIGKDILSNSEPLIIFSNRSFITSKGKYNKLTNTFYPNNTNVSDTYVKEISTIISNKYKISQLILDLDFYRKLYQDLGKL